MEAQFLLETNICIYIRRKKPEQVLRRFTSLRQGQAVLSVITFGELIYAAEKSLHRPEFGTITPDRCPECGTVAAPATVASV